MKTPGTLYIRVDIDEDKYAAVCRAAGGEEQLWDAVTNALMDIEDFANTKLSALDLPELKITVDY